LLGCVVRGDRLDLQDGLCTCKMRTCAQPHRGGASLTRLGCPLTSPACSARVEWGHGGACGAAGHQRQRPCRPRHAGTAPPPHQPPFTTCTVPRPPAVGRQRVGFSGKVRAGVPSHKRGRRGAGAATRVSGARVGVQVGHPPPSAPVAQRPSRRARHGACGDSAAPIAAPPSARVALLSPRAVRVCPRCRSTPNAARLRTARRPTDRRRRRLGAGRAVFGGHRGGSSAASPAPVARQRRWCPRRRQRRRWRRGSCCQRRGPGGAGLVASRFARYDPHRLSRLASVALLVRVLVLLRRRPRGRSLGVVTARGA